MDFLKAFKKKSAYDRAAYLLPESGVTRVVDHIVAMMCRFKIIGSTEFQEKLQRISEGDPEIMAQILPTP